MGAGGFVCLMPAILLTLLLRKNMKKKEIQELKNKPLPELQKLLGELKERLRVFRFDLAAGKVKNVGEMRVLRKDIARVSTFINQRLKANNQK